MVACSNLVLNVPYPSTCLPGGHDVIVFGRYAGLELSSGKETARNKRNSFCGRSVVRSILAVPVHMFRHAREASTEAPLTEMSAWGLSGKERKQIVNWRITWQLEWKYSSVSGVTCAECHGTKVENYVATELSCCQSSPKFAICLSCFAAWKRSLKNWCVRLKYFHDNPDGDRSFFWFPNQSTWKEHGLADELAKPDERSFSRAQAGTFVRGASSPGTFIERSGVRGASPPRTLIERSGLRGASSGTCAEREQLRNHSQPS